MAAALQNLALLFAEHSRKVATLVNIALIIFMSLTVANGVLFYMEMSAPAETGPIRPGSVQPAESSPVYKVSDLELFGRLQEVAAPTEVIDAPETKLNLELQGVFIAEDDKRSTAIIGQRNKLGELYSIGDRLPGNATLASVFVDHVLIRRGTRVEKLMFSEGKLNIAKATASTGSSQTVPGTRPGSTTSRAELEQIRDRLRNAAPPNPEAGPVSNRGSGLQDYTRRLRQDPISALGEVGISAVSEGESGGYRVDASAQSAIRQAGLQPGDVIVSVNGRPVGNVMNDTALIDQVMASSRVRVEVQRGERRFFLTVPVPK
jgi:general secretion pathway protein C